MTNCIADKDGRQEEISKDGEQREGSKLKEKIPPQEGMKKTKQLCVIKELN